MGLLRNSESEMNILNKMEKSFPEKQLSSPLTVMKLTESDQMENLQEE